MPRIHGPYATAYDIAFDGVTLVAFAESIARALSEKQEQLGIATEIEAPLRAAIAAATFATMPMSRFLLMPRSRP